MAILISQLKFIFDNVLKNHASATLRTSKSSQKTVCKIEVEQRGVLFLDSKVHLFLMFSR